MVEVVAGVKPAWLIFGAVNSWMPESPYRPPSPGPGWRPQRRGRPRVPMLRGTMWYNGGYPRSLALPRRENGREIAEANAGFPLKCGVAITSLGYTKE